MSVFLYVCMFSHVWLFVIAHQAALSMGFSRQEYWSGLPLSSPKDLPNPGIEPASPTTAGRFLPLMPPGKLCSSLVNSKFWCSDYLISTFFFPQNTPVYNGSSLTSWECSLRVIREAVSQAWVLSMSAKWDTILNSQAVLFSDNSRVGIQSLYSMIPAALVFCKSCTEERIHI